MSYETHLQEQSASVEIIAEQMQDLNYREYWPVVAEFYEEQGHRMATKMSVRNGHDMAKLDPALQEPHDLMLGTKHVPADRVAEEWYLELGSLNPLNGADKPLLFGFVRMWQAAERPGQSAYDDDADKALRRAVNEISTASDGKPSEVIRSMVAHPERASRALLAGNALLDLVRAVPPAERTKGHLSFLELTRKLNENILDSSLKLQEPTQEQKRVASDALKFKYESAFETLVTEWRTGTLTDEQYQHRFDRVLHRQVNETRKLADHHLLTNGDMHEHYFDALLRYGLTGWRDETRYVVRAATRRQDEPHDNFAPKNIPPISFDAKVTDMEGQEPDRLVQLKLPEAWEQRYARGIIILDDVLESYGNVENREEMMTGLEQMQGLLHELITSSQHAGGTAEITRHINAVEAKLGLAVV